MTKNSVAIIGQSRLAGELLEACRARGLEASRHSDAAGVSAASSIVMDTHADGERTKQNIIETLDAKLPPSSTVVVSCLGFAVSQIASWSSKPERIVGFATFYPLSDRKVVELAAGLRTQESSMKAIESFFQTLDKEPVRVKDAPGLVFPRILSLIINEAARGLEEGLAQAEEIDVAMRLGVNYPAGPLGWADRIGLDEILAVLEGLQRHSGEDRHRPAPLLKKMVLAGWLGESSGKGFYNHNKGKVR
jgi:3-hydroxybutyryl-CoA dehydrogenase